MELQLATRLHDLGRARRLDAGERLPVLRPGQPPAPARGDLGPDLGALFAAHPEAATPPVPCPLPAGGCTFHNGHTIHGAGANMTPGRRRAMTTAFMPAGVRFNGRRDVRFLGDEYLDTLTEGDRLENDELNPVVYSAHAAGARSALG